MDRYGIPIGLTLIALVVAAALGIAWRAARSVARFREEHHDSFLGKGGPR